MSPTDSSLGRVRNKAEEVPRLLTTGRDNHHNIMRTLNMEEKRKLEKLLLSDIDASLTAYSTRRKSEREPLEETALEKPPAEAKRLLAAYVKAQTEIKTAKEALQRLGFGIDHGYANNYAYELEIDYSTRPQAIRDYDAETARVEKSLAAMKRSYTLKLFAGGEEAQTLFASLASELAAIITR